MLSMKILLWFILFVVNILCVSEAYSKECKFYHLAEYNKKEGVYFLKDKYDEGQFCIYEESEATSASLKTAKNIYFDIAITTSKGKVFSEIKIKNSDIKTVYIWRGDLYSFGNQLSGDFFNIVTDSIRLKYLGPKVNFGAGPELVSDYIAIAPGEEIFERITLNSYYQFMPGEHLYDIGTVYMACTYTPGTGDEYLTTDTAFWIRSNRSKILINGDSLDDEPMQLYTVK